MEKVKNPQLHYTHKYMNTKRPTMRRGFTLVELLVVIAILAVLAAVAVPIIMRVGDSGRAASATSAMKDVLHASRGYLKAHGSLEFYTALAADGAGKTSADDPATAADAKATDGYDVLIAGLCGDSSGSKNRIKYLKLSDAKEADVGIYDGLTRNASDVPHGIVDPWGNPYFIQADKDFDEMITVANGAGAKLGGTNVQAQGGSGLFMLSAGPDKEFGTEDDVASNR